MKIKAVCELTELSDRTIRYYIEEQLIYPTYTENYLGRKSFDFSQEDIDLLKNISILRRFDFTIEEIRGILNDAEKSKTIIQDVKNRNSQALAEKQFRQSILSQIEDNRIYTVAELARKLSTVCEGLPKAEEKIRKGFAKTLLSVIKTAFTFLVVWLPVAAQILFFLVTLVVYAYPKFYPETVVYMLLSVLPSLLVVFLSKTKWEQKKIARTALLVLCAVSLLCSYVVFIIPIGFIAKSETTDIIEYRDVDADCSANKDPFFSELFPVSPHYFVNEQQPDGNYKTVYLDAHYYYRYILSFDYTYDIYAQWPLGKEAFDKEVSRVQALYESQAAEHNRAYEIIHKGDYTCLIAYNGDPPFESVTDNYTYYIFAYDEANLIVRYILCDSLENGVDQPYYLSLDW
ncbi:MAG: MerR family transcriptional regulator [Oscillospiraceae bacterium]|nr:MerR family transcriptional regulator [Oscillospiraceae bacterium]